MTLAPGWDSPSSMIVTLCGQKGGSGKSTLSAFLACELLRRGRRVLGVDADPQRTLLTFQSLGGCPGLEVRAMEGTTLHKAGKLDAAARGFDDVVIDTPPRADGVQHSAIGVADVAILPCGPTASEAWAMVASMRIAKEVREVRPRVRAAVVLNRQRPRSALGKTVRGVMVGGGLEVLRTELVERQAFIDALSFGQGVTEYEPRGLAAQEFMAFVDEVVALGNRRVPRG